VARHEPHGKVARLYSHDLVKVKSKRGSVVVKAQQSTTLRPGQCFLPMHWGGNAMGGLGINVLLPGNFDPYSKQPELKHAGGAG
jgi:assimilatory nitrate reductase catalytic subunit